MSVFSEPWKMALDEAELKIEALETENANLNAEIVKAYDYIQKLEQNIRECEGDDGCRAIKALKETNR